MIRALYLWLSRRAARKAKECTCTCSEYSPEQHQAAIKHRITAETEGEFKRALYAAERKGSRPIFYVPDPFQPDRRFEVARIKRGEACKLSDAWWERPDNAHVMREEDRAVIRIVREDLKGWRDFDRLPVSVGPFFLLGDPC